MPAPLRPCCWEPNRICTYNAVTCTTSSATKKKDNVAQGACEIPNHSEHSNSQKKKKAQKENRALENTYIKPTTITTTRTKGEPPKVRLNKSLKRDTTLLPLREVNVISTHSQAMAAPPASLRIVPTFQCPARHRRQKTLKLGPPQI